MERSNGYWRNTANRINTATNILVLEYIITVWLKIKAGIKTGSYKLQYLKRTKNINHKL